MSLKSDVIRGDEATLDAFLIGLQSVPNTTQWTVNGQTYSTPDLITKVEQERAPYKTVRQLNAALKVARTELGTKKSDISVFVRALQTAARAHVGESSPDITRFGFKENKKHKKLTSEEAAARAEKMRATRAARHTMGKRQKKEVHGTTPTPPTPSKP
jgi:hypothetical protein